MISGFLVKRSPLDCGRHHHLSAHAQTWQMPPVATNLLSLMKPCPPSLEFSSFRLLYDICKNKYNILFYPFPLLLRESGLLWPLRAYLEVEFGKTFWPPLYSLGLYPLYP